MRRVNILFAVFLGLGLAGWLVFSDLGGYTSRNAMIMARSTSVVSTIDGEVAKVVARVGSNVSAGSLLVTIENDRIDRNRLTELRSQRAFLKREIVTAETQNLMLGAMRQRFTDKASAYQVWMMKDLEILRRQTFHRLKAAEEGHAVKVTEVSRQAELVRKSHVSVAVLDEAKSEAAIARSQMEALRAELARVELRIDSIKGAGVLLENGSSSYWDEVSDSVEMQLLNHGRQIETMAAKLAQIEDQIVEEAQRLGRSFSEEHRAQFNGVINAVLISEGERVIAGAPLLEVLDCANPIAIVAVPDHRFGDFYIGQKATIQPLDSDERIIGAVQHISSDALISRDTSIAVSSDLKLGGNKVIVAFDNQADNRTDDRGQERAEDGEPASAPAQSCDTARRAAVTIETDTLVSELEDLAAQLIAKVTSGNAFARSEPVSRDYTKGH